MSDGLEDVAVDNNMNKQTTLEDEEALDPIDDIWQEDTNGCAAEKRDNSPIKYKIRSKGLTTRPYVAYEPLKNNCDSIKSENPRRFRDSSKDNV